MVSINGARAGAYVQMPIKQPDYKDDQINGLKAQESSYESQIAQLEAGSDEENAAALQETQSRRHSNLRLLSYNSFTCKASPLLKVSFVSSLPQVT